MAQARPQRMGSWGGWGRAQAQEAAGACSLSAAVQEGAFAAFRNRLTGGSRPQRLQNEGFGCCSGDFHPSFLVQALS